MSTQKRIGMLTPSSNTALEPLTSAMLAGLDDVSVHFGRFRVTRIALSEDALGQFDIEPMLAASRLLADAKVDAICWNGTSAGWLGFESDRRLCDGITAETGIPACSAVLALNDIFEMTAVRRFGLVTPYTADVQGKIVETYAKAGFTCSAERHLDIADNFSFATVADDAISGMIKQVAASDGVQAITTFCTNLKAAQLVERLEQEIDLPIYDTVATALWPALKLAGADPGRIKGWGRLFRTKPLLGL
ncbi:MAG: maleate cis-trans isomerase family protein [Geminicoccaceae bacterium]